MSTLGNALDEALDDKEDGVVQVELGGAKAEVEVLDADRLGVRVSRVKVSRGAGQSVADAAEALPGRLRSLPEQVMPVEVDPGLGGAILRTKPSDMRKREFFEVKVDGEHDREVRRYRSREGNTREEVDWTMTRDQLGRLVDELERDE